MIVKIQDKGSGVTGLHIGARNVRRHFVKSIPTVDLDLDSLQIRCDLAQEFWSDQPEIADPRLCAWLAAKNSSRKIKGDQAVMLMLPAGKNSFRLRPMPSTGAPKQKPLFNPAA
jgi:hypothetical protein